MNKWPNYAAQFTPWIATTKEMFQGKRKAISGNLVHLWHEHLFDYFKVLYAINSMNLSVERDLCRDGNYTLHPISPKGTNIRKSLELEINKIRYDACIYHSLSQDLMVF